jgi:phage terminase large subunit-like protein
MPSQRRIVVAIDPSITSGEESNECGIVCVGRGEDDHSYVLDDASGVRADRMGAWDLVTLDHDMPQSLFGDLPAYAL